MDTCNIDNYPSLTFASIYENMELVLLSFSIRHVPKVRRGIKKKSLTSFLTTDLVKKKPQPAFSFSEALRVQQEY